MKTPAVNTLKINTIDATTIKGYSEVRSRIDAIRERRWARASAVVLESGCFDALQLHNAVVSYRMGRPWAEVNYDLALKAMDMLNSQFIGQRYLDRLWLRVCRVQFGYKGPADPDLEIAPAVKPNNRVAA